MDKPNQPRVYLEMPPESDPALTKEFHNRLMMMCQISFVQLTDSILKRQARCTKQSVGEARAPESAAGAAGSRAGASEPPVAGIAASRVAGSPALAAPRARAASAPPRVPPARRMGLRLRRGAGSTSPLDLDFPETPAAAADSNRAQQLGGGDC